MDPEKKARLEAAGFAVVDTPEELFDRMADPNPPKNASYWKRRALKAEEELAYRKNNFEQSCLWPSTIIQSDQLMPDGRPTKLAVVPNWCIHKIECNARNPKS